ncbi:MAG: hypothetical protein ACFB11_21220 [Paracoccaceae bacterium]
MMFRLIATGVFVLLCTIAAKAEVRSKCYVTTGLGDATREPTTQLSWLPGFTGEATSENGLGNDLFLVRTSNSRFAGSIPFYFAFVDCRSLEQFSITISMTARTDWNAVEEELREFGAVANAKVIDELAKRFADGLREPARSCGCLLNLQN